MEKQILSPVTFLIIVVLIASNVFCIAKIIKVENELKQVRQLKASAPEARVVLPYVTHEQLEYSINSIYDDTDDLIEDVAERIQKDLSAIQSTFDRKLETLYTIVNSKINATQ